MLGEGVLLSVGDRFVTDDPTAVERALAERDTRTPDDDAIVAATEDTSESETDGDSNPNAEADGEDTNGWTTADKAAGVAVTSTGVRCRLGGKADGMSEIKERTESLRADLHAARKREDEAAIERIEAEQREVMAEQVGAMRGQFRPLVWTTLVTIPVFMWLTWLLVDPTGAIVSASTFIPVLGEIVWTARVVGPVQAWILWHGLCSLLANLAAQRALDRWDRPSASNGA
ncbi:hypothetical protein BRD01_00525 [Halobacteriales archaeon QS_8_65_32]|nr:MAG: hypothetical protein BRD01_00525 [Halobacteriales archaeon QS_8_65_32]